MISEFGYTNLDIFGRTKILSKKLKSADVSAKCFQETRENTNLKIYFGIHRLEFQSKRLLSQTISWKMEDFVNRLSQLLQTFF